MSPVPREILKKFCGQSRNSRNKKPLKIPANIREILAAYRRSVRAIYCRRNYTRDAIRTRLYTATRMLSYIYKGDTESNQYHADLSDLEAAYSRDIRRYNEITGGGVNASPLKAVNDMAADFAASWL